MTAPTTTEPLAVWDANDYSITFWAMRPEIRCWLAEHVGDPDDIWRVEFYLTDAPYAIIYRYQRNQYGYLYRHSDDGEAEAVSKATAKLLDELPPEHLRWFPPARPAR